MEIIGAVFSNMWNLVTGASNSVAINRQWLGSNPVQLGSYNFTLSPDFKEAWPAKDSPEQTLLTSVDLSKFLRENVCDLGGNPLRTYTLNRENIRTGNFWGFYLPESSQIFRLTGFKIDRTSELVQRFDNIKNQTTGGHLINKGTLVIGFFTDAGRQIDFFRQQADYFLGPEDFVAKMPKIFAQIKEIFGLEKLCILLADPNPDWLELGKETENKNKLLVKTSSGTRELSAQASQIYKATNRKDLMTKIGSYGNRINLVIASGLLGLDTLGLIRAGIPLESRLERPWP